MSKRKSSSLVLAVVLACLATVGPRAQQSREIENVAAFARLYGVVRFFYPGDASAALDWNREAVNGVARVRTAADIGELVRRLREVMSAIGSDIEIAPGLPPYRPPATSTEPLVAWRYFGAGAADALGSRTYGAKRTNRAKAATNGINGFAGFAQAVPAAELRGKAVRLRGMIRAASLSPASGGALWLRVDRADQARGCFDNMGDRLVRDNIWREYVLQCNVDADATNIFFGVMAVGAATADFDGIELQAPAGNGRWTPLAIKDGGFEADGGTAWGRVGAPDAQVSRLADAAPEGRQFVRIAPAAAPAAGNSSDELFPDAAPRLADHVDADLGSGLRARVPLTLTDTQAKAAPAAPAPGPGTTPVDERLADVVVAWNFYRHFYPYHADAGLDWDARLRPQLARAYAATDRPGQMNALRRLVADARDGHGRVNDQRQRTPPAVLPLQLALVDSKVVVIASRNADIAAGSVIATMDGAPALDRFSAAMEVVSGSRQWREYAAAQEIAFCAGGATVRLGIDSEAGVRPIDVACAVAQPPVEPRPSQLAELSPRIWYVDLTRVKNADLMPVIDTLAAARGVVFDVRGYPTEAGAWILPHLLDAPENDRWMHAAKITGPFGQSGGWQDIGWNLKPAAPKIAGRIVFLTDGRAISYAESVMGYVHDRRLATIVGSTTAGTNGDIAGFTVPSGFTIIFTGLRVTGHDGKATHHLVGVRPDIEVTPTIAGLREGRDEVLARALALLQ